MWTECQVLDQDVHCLVTFSPHPSLMELCLYHSHFPSDETEVQRSENTKVKREFSHCVALLGTSPVNSKSQ